MRRTALVALLLLVPGLALAQDPAAAPAPRPTGTVLFDALPPQADIVVATPDLPALLESLTKAGLGDAAAWRAAFDAQMRAWGAESGDPERLARGGGALLAAADGEVVLASIGMKLPGSEPPIVRATLFAMRTTRDEKALLAAFQDVVDGALQLRYEGAPHTEGIGSRQVTVLPGNAGNLYLSIQDGLVVVCDHPLALGLFFRGLARQPGALPANRPPVGQLKLLVRHGRGDAAWEGWMWGEGESVTCKTAEAAVLVKGSATAVVAVAVRAVADMPLLPSPIEAPSGPVRSATSASAFSIGIDESGAHLWGVDEPVSDAVSVVPGAAWRLGWLRAYANGKLELPIPGLAANLLRGPYESASKSAGDNAGEVIAWKSNEPGHMNGPLGHGPATFLALRSLHDIARGIAPGAAEAAKAPQKVNAQVPLPPPTEPKDK